jgi:phosphoglycolate phosphatase-like HAD superfamily hydrolase
MLDERQERITRTIAVDFDGVIHQWDKSGPEVAEGLPVDGAFEALGKLLNAGYEVVVFTAREDLGPVRTWLKRSMPVWFVVEHGYRLVDSVTGRKPKARFYVDDHAIRFRGSWQDILNYFL